MTRTNIFSCLYWGSKILGLNILFNVIPMQHFFINRKFVHENIVKFYGINIVKDKQKRKYLQILMEICNDTLENMLICRTSDCHNTRKPPCCMHKDKRTEEFQTSWRFYCDMAVGIAQGLAFVHSVGFVHRDLKLTNVLVCTLLYLFHIVYIIANSILMKKSISS